MTEASFHFFFLYFLMRKAVHSLGKVLTGETQVEKEEKQEQGP
jgi:hypothetical protein